MRIAVVMMGLGFCPFVFALAWVVKALFYARHHPGAAAAPDGLLMYMVLLGAYLFAAVVGGGGALLSYWAARRGAAPVAGTSALRIVVTVVLALPAFLYATIRLSST